MRGHIYDAWWEKRICVITGSFTVVPALISIHSRIFMDIHAALAMQFTSPHPPHVSPHALCHYVSGLLAPRCQSAPSGFPPRPRCSALTSTKAGTVCQLDAPRRPTAPEVRNKDDAAAPTASEKKGRAGATGPAHQWTESSNIKSGMGLPSHFYFKFLFPPSQHTNQA